MPIYGNSLLHRLKDLLEVSIIFWNVNCKLTVFVVCYFFKKSALCSLPPVQSVVGGERLTALVVGSGWWGAGFSLKLTGEPWLARRLTGAGTHLMNNTTPPQLPTHQRWLHDRIAELRVHDRIFGKVCDRWAGCATWFLGLRWLTTKANNLSFCD